MRALIAHGLRLVLGLVLVLAVLGVVWRGGLDFIRDAGADLGVFFPRYGSPPWGVEHNMAAREGVLVVDGGCVWMEHEGRRTLPLWPPWTTPVANGERMEIRSRDGDLLAIEGEWFHTAGGGRSLEHAEDLIGRAIPLRCRADSYWVVAPEAQPGRLP